MAEYRIRATGQVMLEDELRRWAKENDGPSWDRTTDEVLEALGADVVFEGPQAQPTRYQVAFRNGVEQQADGKWYTKYSVADMDAEAIAAKDAAQAAAVREDRNKRLADCDWRVIKHLELNENIPGVWEVYRQNLRDVPAQAGFPWEVIWPTEPV